MFKNKEIWTKEDTDFIVQNRNQMTNKELGEKVNRTPLAVATRLYYLGKKRTFGENSEYLYGDDEKKVQLNRLYESLDKLNESFRIPKENL